jgi:hypothetical protein
MQSAVVSHGSSSPPMPWPPVVPVVVPVVGAPVVGTSAVVPVPVPVVSVVVPGVVLPALSCGRVPSSPQAARARTSSEHGKAWARDMPGRYARARGSVKREIPRAPMRCPKRQMMIGAATSVARA